MVKLSVYVTVVLVQFFFNHSRST